MESFLTHNCYIHKSSALDFLSSPSMTLSSSTFRGAAVCLPTIILFGPLFKTSELHVVMALKVGICCEDTAATAGEG